MRTLIDGFQYEMLGGVGRPWEGDDIVSKAVQMHVQLSDVLLHM